MVQVKFAKSKLLLTTLVISIGSIIAASRALTQGLTTTVTALGTSPATTRFANPSADRALTLTPQGSTLSTPNSPRAVPGATIFTNQANHNFSITNITEGNDNPVKIADGDVSIAVTATLGIATTGTASAMREEDNMLTASSQVPLSLGFTSVTLALSADFSPGGFTSVPAGSYTYTVALTLTPP